MTNIYLLTVLAHHEFDKVIHMSAHATREHALEQANMQLATCRANDPEWGNSYGYTVSDLEYHP